ncbi:hypothetical protein AVDCRST_MAG94-2915 [uncultured Leptolyngbya sp.]|uniref:Uncharacterized protein n=1 Tax=uncultured Leptolyngbya sp. TaxID=332963 RepID=A0A6J4MAY0_9CYAN|nr:hypothetical protein AVDCRST_MAG94-2915 [uncultured Leptolyngbya sp.]
MNGWWELFQFWLAVFLGLLWIKRARGTGLHCNVFSAAIAAVVYMLIARAFSYPSMMLSSGPFNAFAGYFVVAMIFQYPTASALTLVLGRFAIPSFHFEKSQFKRCVILLTGWMFMAIILFGFLKLFGLLIVVGLFGAGMPRFITRGMDGNYYLH